MGDKNSDRDRCEPECLPQKRIVEREVPDAEHAAEHANVEGEHLKCCDSLLEELWPEHPKLRVYGRRNCDKSHKDLEVGEGTATTQHFPILIG